MSHDPHSKWIERYTKDEVYTDISIYLLIYLYIYIFERQLQQCIRNRYMHTKFGSIQIRNFYIIQILYNYIRML